MPAPLNYATLQSYVDGGYVLTAVCEGCQYSRDLDLGKMIDRLGAGFNCVERRAELVEAIQPCARCRERKVVSILMHGSTRHMQPGG
jgi:hypothetical protein